MLYLCVKSEINIKPDEYPPDGWNDLNKYRHASKASVFIRKIKEILPQDSRSCFFVSSDNKESKKEIQEVFGPSHIFILEDTCEDRSVDCMHRALAELYILGNTSEKLGSYWSSCLEVA